MRGPPPPKGWNFFIALAFQSCFSGGAALGRAARGATTLSLLVLIGNPSRGLYERLGYESKGPPGGALIACCCYGLFFGSCGAEMMYKQLSDVAAEPGSEAIARE